MDSFEDIAIIGMSCRFPQANSIEEYWNILKNGRCTISSPPEERMALANLGSGVKANFLKRRVDEFDASFFGISRGEANITDPQARILLEVSWEALEDACINPECLRGSDTGVFFGSWLQDYKDIMNLETDPADNLFRKYIGNGFGCTAAKLSHFYEWKGPNVAVECGCSSTMMAVHSACQSILRGDCPLAVACGSNIILQWDEFALWAPDGNSKPFDVRANGYGRGEGVGVLILKKLSQAITDGDRIHGVIKGSFASQEGLSKSFGTPTIECEVLAMKGALKLSKLSPSQVDYVEAHATGTAVGDVLEAAAIVEAYASPEKRKIPLLIASGKGNIGHAESCSGIAGLIKVLLAMRHEAIPPHVSYNAHNPKIDFAPIPARIPTELVEWKRNASRPRRAGVSGFGISGTNLHIVVEEPPAQLPKISGEEFPTHILTISGKTEGALHDFTLLFKEYMSFTPDSLGDIVFTANACRPHHPFRRVLLGSNKEELVEKISVGKFTTGKISCDKSPVLCFTFPGIVGVSDLSGVRTLYDTCPIFRENMDNCNSISEKITGETFLSICNGQGEKADLSNPKHFYLSLLAFPYSLVRLWESLGIKPDVIMGHCGGELVAAVAAGMISLEQAFEIVKVILSNNSKSANVPVVSLAINADVQRVSDLINEIGRDSSENGVEISADNSKYQTVVTGKSDEIHKFAEFCTTKGLRVKDLTNELGGGVLSKFHSREIEPILQRCRESSALTISHRAPKIKYITSVTGKLIESLPAEHWYDLFRNPVQFSVACQAAQEIGCTIYMEMSPGQSLSKLIAENIGNEPSFLVSNGSWDGLLRNLGFLYVAGYPIKWDVLYGNKGTKVSLPHYPFQRKSYWFERKLTPSRREARCMSETGGCHHPLLGTCLDLDLAFPTKVFESQLCTKKSPYLADHVVGNELIFPAAGFIEMMFSAGRTAINAKLNSGMEENCLVVNDFEVASALLLQNDLRTVTQTVINEESLKISIFCRGAGAERETRWKIHASATLAWETHSDQKMDLSKTSSVMAVDNEKLQQFYKQQSKLGLNFGPRFRTLQRLLQANGTTLVEIELPEDFSDNYFIHPVVLDAMLQTFILHAIPLPTKLHVPVRISKLLMFPAAISRFQSNHSHTLFVYCGVKQGEDEILLVDSAGNILCQLMSPELVATTVSSVLRAAGALQDKQIPDLHGIFWKKCSSFGSSPDDGQWFDEYDDESEISDLSLHANKYSAVELELDRDLNRLCSFYVINCLYELGWSVHNSEVIVADELISDLKIVPSLIRPFKQYLSFLLDLELVTKTRGMENDVYLIKKDKFPTPHKVQSEIYLLVAKLKGYKSLPVVQTCGNNMARVLKGELSAHYLLFGDQVAGTSTSSTLAEIFYKECRLIAPSSAAMVTELNNLLQNGKTQEKAGRVLKILELGSGTGTFSKMVLKTVAAVTSHFEYWFTDISSSFFANGEKQFAEEYGEKLTFKIFDAEKDGLKQGIPPFYFDLIIAADVLHVTRHLRQSLSRLRIHLRKMGRILISETNIPLKEVDVTFGLLESYWQFEDLDLRQSHCVIPVERWASLLASSGFAASSIRHGLCYNGQKSIISAMVDDDDDGGQIEEDNNVWLILHDGEEELSLSFFLKQMSYAKRKCVTVSLVAGVKNEEVEKVLEKLKHNLEGVLYFVTSRNSGINVDQSLIVSPLLHILQFFLQSKLRILPKLLVVTAGVWHTDSEENIEGMSSSAATLWGIMRTARLEIPGLKSKCVDLQPQDFSKYRTEELWWEMWIEDKESEVAYREGTRFLRRLQMLEQLNPSLPELPYPRSSGYVIEIPKTRLIPDLKFVVKYDPERLSEDQVQVRVYTVSLNFRDVCNIIKPHPDFESVNTIGMDLAGVVEEVGSSVKTVRVGDPVYGCNFKESCVSSQVVTSENLIAKIPNHLTFSEAAALPTVFLTAWYCMVHVAQLKAGQTMLLHAASGGVGLAAIQISQILGVNVVGTAGSPKKRSYLRSLGIYHVFNSRTLEFGEQILKIGGGRGVDMVLNCLTGPGFKETSLEVIKDGGHFVEMSKLEIFTPEQVRKLRPRVNYTVVDLPQTEPTVIKEMIEKLNVILEAGQFKPPPITKFPASQIVKGITLLQSAKHAGKIVLEMPKYNLSMGIFEDKLFSCNSSYLITGGMGEIGIAIAEWMVTQGAKFIILAGRSSPTPKTLQVIDKMRSQGAQIICEELDVSNFEQCRALILKVNEEINLPPLRGMHHCAGMLQDKMISQLTWEDFEYVFRSKVNGAYNLHNLTLNSRLEFFVVHSSFISTFGNRGQSNHAAANAYMDSLMEMRNALELPGMAVNWGQWDAGLAKGKLLEQAEPFPISHGINALNKFFRENVTSVVAANLDLSWINKAFPDYERTLMEYVGGNQSLKTGTKGESMETRGLLRKLVETGGNEIGETITQIKLFVRNVVQTVLGLKDEDEVDPNLNFHDMGMDSLMTIDFTNRVQTELGDDFKLGFVDMEEFGTVVKMSELLLKLISKKT